MYIDPAELDLRSRYKLLIGGIIPRPIAFVSTVDPEGRPNLAPFSFFNGVSAARMTLLFCPANKPDGTEKDTLVNIAGPWREDLAGTGRGEFVVNTVSAAIVRRAAACAEPLPRGDSEFELAGLTPAPCRVVAPPRVAESPLAYECRALEVIRLDPGQPAGGNIVIGRVVGVHAEDGLIDERWRVDPARLDAVGRLGGLGYCTTRERFEIPLGRAALEGDSHPRDGGAESRPAGDD